MAILRIYYQNQKFLEKDLSGLDTLTIGRADTNDIVLDKDLGVSKQHLILKLVDNEWRVELVSKNNLLLFEDRPVNQLILTNGIKFAIPGYQFEFIDVGKLESGNTYSNAEDKTEIGVLPFVPTLVRYDDLGQVADTITLSGTHWVIGRDPSCTIYLNFTKLSRKHFEILRKEGRFFIRDLGSSNGTFLNGRLLPESQWSELSSGDEISVYDLKFRFVLRDPSFASRVEQAQKFLTPFVTADNNPSQQTSVQDQVTGNEAKGPSSESVVTKRKRVFIDLVKNPVRLLILLLIVGGLIAYLFIDLQPTQQGPSPTLVMNPFDALPPDKKELVKQLYRSAQNFMQEGRYELARQEILKLKQIVPYYEQSERILEEAKQQLAMLEEKEKLEAEAREREIIQEKIRLKLEECRKLVNPKIEMYEIDLCLAPIVEFDPSHPEVLALKAQVQLIIEERKMKEAQEKEYAERVSRLKNLYQAARLADEKQDWLKAIKLYQDVIDSKLPDPMGLKAKSKARQNEIQEMLLARQKEVEKLAEEFYKQGQLKKAIQLIREGIVINPENQVLIGRHEEWMNELRKAMMDIYQEGVLEESVGEVAAAKEKWMKIKELSLPGEDYYEKSKMKLKKYGVWE